MVTLELCTSSPSFLIMDSCDKPSPGSVEDLLFKDPTKLTAPIKDLKEKYELLPAFLKVRRRRFVEAAWK